MLPDAQGPVQEIDGIIALDRLPGRLSDARVRYVIGDVANYGQLSNLFDATVDGIFHLAAVVSGTAEADFALGGPQAGVELCERDHSRAARRCPGHMPCRAGYIIVAYLAMPADCFSSACCELPAAAWSTERSLNLPGITVRVRDMVEVVETRPFS